MSTRSYRGLLAVLALALAILACNLPETQISPAPKTLQPPMAFTEELPQPTETPIAPTETPQPDVNFAGISFSFDDLLAGGVKEEIIPSSQYKDAPFWDIYPEYRTYSLENYLLQERFHEPAIRVYPSAEYVQVNPDVAKVIAQLKDFLTQCPDNSKQIPFLPTWNAAQMMRTQIKCLAFQNGRGVRFLSQYGQSAYPVNNHDMFYTFQGLTNDDAYYVSIVLPISHPSLSENGENPPGGDWAAFSDNFMTYIQTTEQTLNQQPEDSFQPAIGLLDKMIASVLIKE
ncbi:MAG: hypothetical protein IT308_04015 [Anaerolineaceae bacterium]|nr:hypothetical protein [Anaerolineaceae bacterium]